MRQASEESTSSILPSHIQLGTLMLPKSVIDNPTALSKEIDPILHCQSLFHLLCEEIVTLIERLHFLQVESQYGIDSIDKIGNWGNTLYRWSILYQNLLKYITKEIPVTKKLEDNVFRTTIIEAEWYYVAVATNAYAEHQSAYIQRLYMDTIVNESDYNKELQLLFRNLFPNATPTDECPKVRFYQSGLFIIIE